MIKLIKKIVIFLLSASLISTVLIIAILWVYSNKLPDYKFLKMYKPAVSSKLYSGSGDLVSDFSSEKRIFVKKKRFKSEKPKKTLNKFCITFSPKNYLTITFLYVSIK